MYSQLYILQAVLYNPRFGRGRKTPDEHLTKGEGERHEDRGITDRGGPYQDNQQKQQIWRDAQPQYDR